VSDVKRSIKLKRDGQAVAIGETQTAIDVGYERVKCAEQAAL